MTNEGKTWTWTTAPDPYPSMGIQDPLTRLGQALLLQSVRDLRSPDPIKAIDALAFWIDGNGPAYLDSYLNIFIPDDKILIFLVGAENEKYKSRGNIKRQHRADER